MTGISRLGVLASLLAIFTAFVLPGDQLHAIISISPQTSTAPGGRTVSPAPAPPPASQINLNLDLALEKIQTSLNQYKLDFAETGKYGILNYNLNIKIGAIALSSSGDTGHPLRLSAPFTLTGTAGFLTLNETGQATIDLGTDFGANWCPGVSYTNLQIALDSKAHSAAFGRSISDLSGPITYFVDADLKKYITCDTFKNAVAGFWGSKDWPFQIKNKTWFLNANPQAISLSNMRLAGGRLAIAVTLTVAVTVGNKAIAAKQLKLPDTITRIGPPPQSPSTPDAAGSFQGNIDLDAR